MGERQKQPGIDVTTKIVEPGETGVLPQLRPFDTISPAADVREMAGKVWRLLFDRKYTPTEDELLQNVGRNALSVKALGWLAREDMWENDLWGDIAKPRQSLYRAEDDAILEKPPTVHEAFTDWQMDVGVDNAYRDAFRRAFEYGMWRRQQTYDKPVAGEDEAIGSTAGNMLRYMFGKTPADTIASIANEAYENPGTSRESERERLIAVAAGLGWLVHENKVVLEGQDELKVNLVVQEGYPHEKADMIRAHADRLVGSLRESKGEAELTQLLGKNDGDLGNALAVGYLLRDRRIRLESREGSVIVKAT